MNRLIVISGLVIAVLAVACVKNTNPDTGPGVVHGHATQACFDRSGSYSFVEQAMRTFREAVPTYLGPDDTVYLRWIESNSYAPQAAIQLPDGKVATFHFPQVELSLPTPEPFSDPSVVAAFEQQAKRLIEQQAQFDGLLASAEAEIQAIVVPPPSDRTDVFGCIAKACELLEGPGDVLWIASDMEDNVGYQADCNLHGAAVVVTLFQCETPCPEKRWIWASFFGSHGAAGTTYLDPSLTAEQVANKLEEVRDGS